MAGKAEQRGKVWPLARPPRHRSMTTPTIPYLAGMKSEHEAITGRPARAWVMSASTLGLLFFDLQKDQPCLKVHDVDLWEARCSIMGLPVYRVIEDDVLEVI